MLIFGTKKLRNIGQDLGGAVKGFKEGMKSAEDARAAPTEADAAVAADRRHDDRRRSQEGERRRSASAPAVAPLARRRARRRAVRETASMFDIGFSEIVVIAVVALIVIGPERLPKTARTLGHLFGRLQRYVNDVKADINREMELDELRKLQRRCRRRRATSKPRSIAAAQRASRPACATSSAS